MDEEEEERQRLGALLSTFSESEMRRYENFRRAHLDKRKVRTLISEKSGQKKISDQLTVAMGGIAKVFAGELIEIARHDMKDYDGPIHPLHIRNAYRKLCRKGKVNYLGTQVQGLLD